jgi:membrane protein CcdC involved in cytochrome C biogenesis
MVMPQFASILVSLAGGSMIILLRMRASNRPTTLRKIIIPPLGMSTGFMMFIEPAFRIPFLWALTAFVIGAVVFSYPLIRSTTLNERNGIIYMNQSKAFLGIIICMLAIRLLLHDYVEHYISVPQTGGLFFILAFGMIVTWRLSMLRAYLRIAPRSTDKAAE